MSGRNGGNFRYAVTLQPVVAEAKADRSIAKSLNAPPFLPSEILEVLASGCFRLKLEVDSQYDQESVQANFTRLLGTPGRAYSAKRADVKSYKLKSDAYEANLAVELWPYRGGTKATVTAVVTAQPTSVEPGIRRTIDVQKTMDMVRKEIEKIVKS